MTTFPGAKTIHHRNQVNKGGYVHKDIETLQYNHQNKSISDRDLKTGSYVSLYGKQYYILNCDDNTQKYYKEKYGIEQEDMLITAISKCDHKSAIINPKSSSVTPRQNNNLMIDYFKRQGNRLHAHYSDISLMDAIAYTSKIMHPSTKVNQLRNFVVYYYPLDHSIEIHEVVMLNSGVEKHKFTNRVALNKESAVYILSCSSSNGLSVGATLCVYEHKFEITGIGPVSLQNVIKKQNKPQSTKEDPVEWKGICYNDSDIKHIAIEKINQLRTHLETKYSTIQTLFNKYSNQAGLITPLGVQCLFEDCNISVGNTRVKHEILNVLDKDGDGSLNFEEFATSLLHQYKPRLTHGVRKGKMVELASHDKVNKNEMHFSIFNNTIKKFINFVNSRYASNLELYRVLSCNNKDGILTRESLVFVIKNKFRIDFSEIMK